MQTTSRSVLLAAALSASLPSTALAADAGASAGHAMPIVLAVPRDFASAVKSIESATGAKGEKMRIASDVPLDEGRGFSVERRLAERLLEGSHGVFKKAGLYLFRYERSFGLAGEKDRIGLLKTADRSAVLRRVGTAGPANDKIATWLDALAKDEPFELWEVGIDYVAGRFDRAPKDSMAVARRCAEIAPDLVAGRASTLELLAREIRMNQTLYLIF